MTDEGHPQPAQPAARRTTPPTSGLHDDERASPLGRGADAGPIDMPQPLSSTQGEIAGQRGAWIPGARSGDDGALARENEDADERERRLD